MSRWVTGADDGRPARDGVWGGETFVPDRPRRRRGLRRGLRRGRRHDVLPLPALAARAACR